MKVMCPRNAEKDTFSGRLTLAARAITSAAGSASLRVFQAP